MAAPTRTDLARLAATEARIAALDLPKGGFTAAARASALARLRAAGLPARRDEYWRWTDPAAFNASEAPAGAALRVDAPIFEGRDKVRLVFVDGVLDADASDTPVLAGSRSPVWPRPTGPTFIGPRRFTARWRPRRSCRLPGPLPRSTPRLRPTAS